MADETALVELVGQICDAALEPSSWPAVLERLGDMLGGCPSIFGLHLVPEGGHIIAAPRWRPDCLRLFEEHYRTEATNHSVGPIIPTDTHRQAELMRLVLSSATALEGVS